MIADTADGLDLLVEDSERAISRDGRNLRVGAETYALTKAQGRAFLVLFHAHRRNISLTGAEVLRSSGSGSARLVDVFRRHGDGPRLWRQVIVQGRARGTYTLRLPPASKSGTAHASAHDPGHNPAE